MNKKEQLIAIEHYVYQLFHSDPSGHDFYHMRRVANLARIIAVEEKADLFICQAAAWLHDVGDKKLFQHPQEEIIKLNQFLASINIPEQIILAINDAFADTSFHKHKIPKTLPGKIVQDADRIDAIGAIGIARTFAYGGAKGQLIYDDENKKDTSLHHFYDKLMKLYELMHTETARKIAYERHQFIKTYVNQFLREW